MKRFLSMACGLMLVAGVWACESSDDNGKDDLGGDVITRTDTLSDPGGTTDPGRDPGQVDPDLGQDPGTNVDPGVDKDPGDEQDPGTTTDPGDPGTCILDPLGSCRAVYECMGDCPDGTAGDACVQQCQNSLSAEGMADYQAFNQCLQTRCSGVTNNDEFYECLEANCMNEYYGCFWGCTYLTCDDMKVCVAACPDDNPATADVNEFGKCLNDCQSESTTEAQIECANGDGGCYGLLGCLNSAQSMGDRYVCIFGASEDALDMYNAIPDCLLAACPVCEVTNPTPQQEAECDTCFSAEQREGGACNSTLVACQEDRTYGTGGCYDLLGCLNAAETPAERQVCADASSKAATELYDAIPDCLITACPICETEPDGAACNTCWSDEQKEGGACAATLLACQEDRTYGTGKCNDLLGCLNAAETPAERQACANAASKDGITLYDAISTCLIAACPICETEPDGAACNTCWSDEQKEGGDCYDTLQACIDDRIYGTGGCNDLMGCLDAATTLAERQACGSAASEAAIDLYDAIPDCLIVACPICESEPDGAACETCWSTEQQEGGDCYATLQACIAD